jgi:hypothetical protein
LSALSVTPASDPAHVVHCSDIADAQLGRLLARYGAEALRVAASAEIPGSYWGAPEAGLVARRIYFRDDTPVHSLLHEFSHYVCMTPLRRAGLDTDAGGDDAEECAVCYLEVLLARHLAPFDSARCLADMDAWGYSFREGSAQAWFHGDGLDARDWLRAHGLIDLADAPTWRLRAETN